MSVRCLPAVVLALVVALGGCSHALSIQQQEAPPATVSVLAIGPIVADDANHRREVRRFQRALFERLHDSWAFERVLSPPPATLPQGAVVLTGHVHRIGDGAEALRFVGFSGVGAPRVRARFEIREDAGVRLAAFSQSVRSFEGTGYAAHWNPVYLDDVVDELAERTADAIVRWRHGESLQPDFLAVDDIDLNLFDWDLFDWDLFDWDGIHAGNWKRGL
jgi:hypothetical protein